jgi:hypothetical protein
VSEQETEDYNASATAAQRRDIEEMLRQDLARRGFTADSVRQLSAPGPHFYLEAEVQELLAFPRGLTRSADAEFARTDHRWRTFRNVMEQYIWREGQRRAVRRHEAEAHAFADITGDCDDAAAASSMADSAHSRGQ